MKKYIIIMIAASLVVGCGHGQTQKKEFETETEQTDTMEVVPVIVKDSIDLVIEERATHPMNSSIFAGLHFGDSKATVERVMNDKSKRSFKVPDGDKVGIVEVRQYDAEYFNGKLASLVLYAEEDEFYHAAGTLFATKYGCTKENTWKFSDCTISVKLGHRELYDPQYEAGYGHSSGTPMYFLAFKGPHSRVSGTPLTKDPSFLKIIYENNVMLCNKKRQEEVKDSLERERTRIEQEKQKAKEREEAQKLATEPATNI